MELRLLHYFLAICKEGNLTHAALQLHISQPALSKQLKELEIEVGGPLFIRSKQKMILTDKGILFKQRAKQIIALTEKTLDEMHQEQAIVGNLYIGTGHTDHLSKILKIIHDFQVIHPHVKFHLTSGDKYTLLEQINQGLLDFGIFIREFDKTKYDGIPLNLTNQLGILVSSDHHLASKDIINAQDIENEAIIVSRQALNDGEVPSFINEDHIIGTYDLPEIGKTMVKENLGIALIIDNKNTDPLLKFIPIEHMPQFNWYIIWKKDSKTKLQQTFIDELYKKETEDPKLKG